MLINLWEFLFTFVYNNQFMGLNESAKEINSSLGEINLQSMDEVKLHAKMFFDMLIYVSLPLLTLSVI